MASKNLFGLVLLAMVLTQVYSFHFGMVDKTLRETLTSGLKFTASHGTNASNDDPKAAPYADMFYMPFTETLYLKNDFYTNKANPSTTNGEFYYHFSSGSQLVKRDNCMGDRFASGVRNLENTPCWHIVKRNGKVRLLVLIRRKQILLLAGEEALLLLLRKRILFRSQARLADERRGLQGRRWRLLDLPSAERWSLCMAGKILRAVQKGLLL